MSSIIEVSNISKKYRIREKQLYYSLRDSIAHTFRNPLSLFGNDSEEFWALRNLSFKIRPGEVVGIIGKNGAGKSTLLKIISRITPPTKGYIKLSGRTASLLEVGTGFHPELTGRENIFLNGSILGMTRQEINSKFDQIVAFAEIDQFLGTPVKHYSSGMYTRLAFAVAAHLEPEILIVDEVLSVGDAAFQKKSLGKMQEVSRHGRTVLFVSHNLPAVINICSRVLYLDKGRLIADGIPEEVVSKYLEETRGKAHRRLRLKSLINKYVRVLNVQATDSLEKSSESFDIRNPVTIEITYETLVPHVWIGNNIQVITGEGVTIFNSPEDINRTWKAKNKGVYKSRCTIPGNFLSEGMFFVRATINASFGDETFEIDIPEAVTFEIFDRADGDSVRGKTTGFFPGIVRPKLSWEKTFVEKTGKKV